MLEWKRGAEAEVTAATAAQPEHVAKGPNPSSAQHCYAVIFSSQLRGKAPDEAYEDTATRMMELASKQAGFLGIDSARGADGFGITVSYWEDEDAIRLWKQDVEHKAAQESGIQAWYREYRVRVSKVERAYGK